MRGRSIIVIGTIALALIGTIIIKAALTNNLLTIITPLAFMLSGVSFGMLLAYIGNRFQGRFWKFAWFLIGAILLVSILLAFDIEWDLQHTNERSFVSFYIGGYFWISSLTKSSPQTKAPEKKPSLFDDTVSAMFRGAADGIVIGGGCGVILFLLITLLNIEQAGPSQLIWLIVLPAAAGGVIGALKNKGYARKRRAAMDRNPELAKLFYRLGDGVRYDSGACKATFRSRSSAEAFRQTAPDWQVKHMEREKKDT